MMHWKITFYNQKVAQTVLKWPGTLRAKLAHIFELIKEEGADLGMPLTRALGNGLFEIRVKAKNNIGRVFFCYIYQAEIKVLHVFIKKTQQTPKKELALARKRLKEVIQHDL